jgi:hypothetical protein
VAIIQNTVKDRVLLMKWSKLWECSLIPVKWLENLNRNKFHLLKTDYKSPTLRVRCVRIIRKGQLILRCIVVHRLTQILCKTLLINATQCNSYNKHRFSIKSPAGCKMQNQSIPYFIYYLSGTGLVLMLVGIYFTYK